MLVNLEINKSNLEKNLKIVRSINKNLICVIKDNAYGLGIENILPILLENKCDYFAVAYIEEAVKIQKLLENLKLENQVAREGRLGQVRVTDDQSWVYLDDEGTEPTPLSDWFDAGVAKVCVYVDGEDALLDVARQGREQGFAVALVRDAGLTEFHGETTYTCLAFEPLPASKIDPITGSLPLY